MKCMTVLGILTILVEVLGGQQPAPSFGLNNATFVVKLMSPLSSKTAAPGHTFEASVEEPSAYQGAIMAGRITKIKKSRKGKGNGKAEMQFQFDTLSFNNRVAPVRADLTAVRNSKGVSSVDEEGQVIGKTSNKKRAGVVAGGAALGAIIGAAAAGAPGAAIGAAAGGVAGAVVGVRMTTTGSNIEFMPGSLFTLTVSDATPRRR